jgi:hypothetical protein
MCSHADHPGSQALRSCRPTMFSTILTSRARTFSGPCTLMLMTNLYAVVLPLEQIVYGSMKVHCREALGVAREDDNQESLDQHDLVVG